VVVSNCVCTLGGMSVHPVGPDLLLESNYSKFILLGVLQLTCFWIHFRRAPLLASRHCAFSTAFTANVQEHWVLSKALTSSVKLISSKKRLVSGTLSGARSDSSKISL
jgi:hypothetical protein